MSYNNSSADRQSILEALDRPSYLNTLTFDWVTIPAGWFLMGSDPAKDRDAHDDEKPQHRVYLSAFCIARVPVTVEQFAKFAFATNYYTDQERAKSEYVWYQPNGPGRALKAHIP